jgi:aminoglycoside phosphotransferase (APT) family kinase protein
VAGREPTRELPAGHPARRLPPVQRDAGAIGVTPWDGFPVADELVERYAKGTDRDLEHIDWYAVLACYKLGIILEGTHARACAGRAPRATGDILHATTVGLFERALARIG